MATGHRLVLLCPTVRMRVVGLVLFVLLLGQSARADGVRFACPQVINVSAIWIDGGPCLRVHVSVLHGSPLAHDGQSYVLDRSLAERVQDDFGPFAPLVLRRIEQRLEALEGPPRDVRIQRAAIQALAHLGRQLPYRIRPHVELTQNTELWVHELARSLLRRMGHTIIITSGTRTPQRQAAAMFGKLVRGGRYRSLYKKRELAQEIRQAFLLARRQGKRRVEIIAAMTAVIEEQVRQGLLISAHLKQVAVDVRSHDMTRRVKRVFRRIAESIDGMHLLNEEQRPPHFHLEVPSRVVLTGCPHLEQQLPASMPASAPAR